MQLFCNVCRELQKLIQIKTFITIITIKGSISVEKGSRMSIVSKIKRPLLHSSLLKTPSLLGVFIKHCNLSIEGTGN